MTAISKNSNSSSKWREFLRSRTLFVWLLITPAALFMFLIVGWPLLETIRLSFTNAGLGGEQYIGWENYEKLLNNRKYPGIVGRTFYWMFLSVLLKMVIGTAGALLLNAKIRGKAAFRVMVMPPWIVPMAIGCIGWLWLYNGHFGILAGVLMRLGIIDGPFEFLAYKSSAFYSAVVTDVWIGTPMIAIFILAAMQSVPDDLYEAAYVDGASRWYRFRRITIPQIMPVIVTMSLLSAIWTFNSFEIIWILTEGGPRGATTTMIIDTYKMAIANYKFGYGATRALMVVLSLAAFSLLYLILLNKINERYKTK
ncbi:MAG: sugar ABC transporter permease [SAR324 cluster bacterium]|jgi:multiple sugar transport system permease protein|uniref:ABC transmembrane type-1 domain-containing protein n=1 Tax=marine metagenome TaxID=408172 RepID=A0A381QCZ0_9ZZZZ|nr:sugar ABC transporter permease [SAR324 cluster bacterium]|tara:strand:- start:293 stop:1222 length:930 start_codon:yes stop_codon:yes gene_type:complete